jgi:transposase-like protein
MATRFDWKKMKARASALIADPGHTYVSAAEELSREFKTNVTWTALEKWSRREGLRKASPTKTKRMTPPLEVLDRVIKPLAEELPPRVTSTKGRTIVGLLYGDTHFPYQDDRALAIVGQIAEQLQPDVIVHMGDLLDCYSLSRFDKDPTRMETIQDEIDMGRAHMAQMRRRSPNSQYILLEGNHPDRLRRVLWKLPGEAAFLHKLTAFRETMTWNYLLGLDDLDIEFVPYGTESRYEFLPKFIVKHGNVVRKHSAMSAKAELEKYNRSGASGHTHRLGMFMHRDHNGNHIWLETGCTCGTDPEYTADPDWQQGCVVMTFDKTTGAFQAEVVYIKDGLAVFRGQVLTA